MKSKLWLERCRVVKYCGAISRCLLACNRVRFITNLLQGWKDCGYFRQNQARLINQLFFNRHLGGAYERLKRRTHRGQLTMSQSN
jgi:hypothetical protein